MSEAIKAQYRVLNELRRVDDKIVRFQKDISRIPEEIAKLDAVLASRKQELEKQKELFETTEKALRKLEQDLKEREDNLHKAEGKMMEVKTNEEYQAAMKENSGLKDSKGKIEENILTQLAAVDESRKVFKESEKTFKEFEATLKADKQKLEAERTQLVNLLETQTQQRQQISTQLDSSVLVLYQRLATRGRGGPVAIIENGMCLSCNMAVRPQLYNEVLGYKQIHQCPSCAKILLPRQEAEKMDGAIAGTA